MGHNPSIKMTDMPIHGKKYIWILFTRTKTALKLPIRIALWRGVFIIIIIIIIIIIYIFGVPLAFLRQAQIVWVTAEQSFSEHILKNDGLKHIRVLFQ